MIYLIIFLVMLYIIFVKKINRFIYNQNLEPLVFLFVIIMCFGILIGSIMYFISIGEVAEMEAFQENTLAVYEYTIEKSEGITINAVERAEKQFSEILDTGNLAYFELAKSVNSNIQELRESIRIYNTRLYTYRKYNANWFTEIFVCDVPEYLKPIQMK